MQTHQQQCIRIVRTNTLSQHAKLGKEIQGIAIQPVLPNIRFI